MYKIFLTFFLLINTLHSYESEDKLKVVIIGKVAKFIKWKDNNYDKFIITILGNSYGKLFDTILSGKKINNKEIEIKYINNITELSNTNILYIPITKAKELPLILEKTKGKNILTISDIRGFADKNGIMQIYFASQKVKLRINLATAQKDNLKISSFLLRIADVVKG